MRFFGAVMLLVLIDTTAYFSVPLEVRQANRWAVMPFAGGIILAVEFHFWNGRLPRTPQKESI